jgi:hypothetical protein
VRYSIAAALHKLVNRPVHFKRIVDAVLKTGNRAGIFGRGLQTVYPRQ